MKFLFELRTNTPKAAIGIRREYSLSNSVVRMLFCRKTKIQTLIDESLLKMYVFF
jgi:hypothetical protein